MMKAPENVKVYDSPTSIYWFDKDNVLYSVSKKVPAQSLEEAKKTLEDFKKTLPQEKVCMLLDVTNSTETKREVREWAAEEFPKMVKAIAMVSDSALGKMLANLFFSLKAQPYPTKMFNDEKAAREWLNQYL